MRRKIRLLAAGLCALAPSPLKVVLYRLLFGYKISKDVRIGLSLIDVQTCEIEDGVYIGHFNLIIGVKSLKIGEKVRIGHLNIIRGGDEVTIGKYAEIIRLNEINSIPDPDIVTPADPVFRLGDGSVITTGHKIDFTDRVEIGAHTILGGRNSSLWTHNRQRTQPVTIGSYSYIGSEIRVAPGGAIPSRCIVGIGSVIVGKLHEEEHLIAGVPAKAIRPLTEEDRFLIEYRTRPDLPEDLKTSMREAS
jgi:acetyltransferase-like isoleucine patch superfamily enzyme